MTARTGVVVNGLALRIGGGASGMLQLLGHLPADWTDVVVLVDHPLLDEATAAVRAGGRDDVVVATVPPRFGRLDRTLRVVLEHLALPLRHWRRGRRTWIALGNLPAAAWPGRQVVLVQSMYLIGSLHDHLLRAQQRVMVRFQRGLLRLLSRRIAGVVYISETSARSAEGALASLPWRVAHYGVAARTATAEGGATWSGPGTPLKLVMASTLYRHKGIEHVLHALGELRTRVDARLDVIGAAADPGYLAELQALSSRLGIADAVRWRGRVDDEELAAALGQAHVYLLLSTVETFGLTWLEAQAAGLAVVAPDIPLAREVLGDGAVFVDPTDAGSVAAAAVTAASTSDHLRAAAAANVEAHAVDRTASAFWVACDELLGGAA